MRRGGPFEILSAAQRPRDVREWSRGDASDIDGQTGEAKTSGANESSFYVLNSHHESNPLEFRGEGPGLLSREFDQRRPYRPPRRIVRVSRDRLLQRAYHRILFAEHVAHDI